MQKPPMQKRHGSPRRGGAQSATDWHVSACSGKHVKVSPWRHRQNCSHTPAAQKPRMQGFPSGLQSPSL